MYTVSGCDTNALYDQLGAMSPLGAKDTSVLRAVEPRVRLPTIEKKG